MTKEEEKHLTLKLSILIPTLNERWNKFAPLVDNLITQGEEAGYKFIYDFEIIAPMDNRRSNVGNKRNICLDMANGDFTVFIDDDDQVADDYVKSILDAITNNPNIDAIGFKGKYYVNGEFRKGIWHSKRWRVYSENETHYLRYPNHLNPIHSNITKRYRFNTEGDRAQCGEDYDWATAIHINNEIKNEYFIDKCMYHYYFDTKLTATQLK